MTCRNICLRYKAKKGAGPDTRYGNGQVRCKACDIYIYDTGGIFCPCCNRRLSLRAHKGSTKARRIRADMRIRI